MSEETNPSLEDVVDLSTQEGYDLWSAIYDDEDNPLVRLEQSRMSELLGNVAGLSILDLGCGTGRHAVALAQQNAQVTAVDFSSQMLAKAKAKPGADRIRFLEADLTQPIPLADNSFDRALCCLVMDHVPDPVALFSEMRRLCKPAGFVVMTVMHPAMNLRGVQARFRDPHTQQIIRPESTRHQISDYVMAAIHAGLELELMGEHVVDEALVSVSPRGARYLGWPLLLEMRLKPVEKHRSIST